MHKLSCDCSNSSSTFPPPPHPHKPNAAPNPNPNPYPTPRLERAGLTIPTARVIYRNLTVTRQAAVGASAAVPTVASVLRDAGRSVVGRSRAGSLNALECVEGLLRCAAGLGWGFLLWCGVAWMDGTQ